MAQQAQDPNHPANPGNPKVLISPLPSPSSSSPFILALSRGFDFAVGLTKYQHHEWVKNMASKFGNAAMFGAGATFGGDMVNDVLKQF
jgi:hypothetical protein